MAQTSRYDSNLAEANEAVRISTDLKIQSGSIGKRTLKDIRRKIAECDRRAGRIAKLRAEGLAALSTAKANAMKWRVAAEKLVEYDRVLTWLEAKPKRDERKITKYIGNIQKQSVLAARKNQASQGFYAAAIRKFAAAKKIKAPS